MQLLLGTFLVIFLLYVFVQRKYAYWKRRGIPYVEPTFPYGTLPLGKNKPHSSHLEMLQYRKFKGLTPFAGLFFGLKPGVLATDLNFIRKILITDFGTFHDRGFYFNEEGDPLSANLISMEGQSWKRLRNKLSPSFTSGRMKFMFPTLMAVCSEFVSVLEKECQEGSEVEMREMLARFGTDVIASCAFGVENHSLSEPQNEFREMGKKPFSEPKISRLMRFIVSSYKGVGRALNVKVNHEDVAEFFTRLVRDIVEYRETTRFQRNDFMDMLIKMKNSPNPDEHVSLNEIAAQAFVFFVAGFETSSTVTAFALYELALNQDIQERARECVEEVLRRHDGKFTYEAVNEMAYVDQCLSESMRKYPPATTLFREASKDYSYDGLVIEKGTALVVPVYALHHDPDVWPEPDNFSPERFDPKEPAKRHPMSYLPFGEGPRNCIGLRFGLMQARVGLSRLLHHFRFSLSPKTPKSLTFRNETVVLTPKESLYFCLERVTGN